MPRARLDEAARQVHPRPMLVFKVLRAGEYAAFREEGATDGAPIDLADGFIHLSTAEQAPETLRKHFAGESGLVALAIETENLGAALKWEPSRGGALFPHLYRPLRAADVLWVAPIRVEDGAHIVPDGPK